MKYIKYLIGLVIVLGLLAAAGYAYLKWYAPKKYEPVYASHDPLPARYKADRLSIRPIVHVDMHSGLKQEADNFGYVNINGPCLIKTPDWLENKLGEYYLYFAHHKGAFLRLAVADNIGGPWRMYPYPVMPLPLSGFAQKQSAQASGLKDLKKYFNPSEIAALAKVGEDAAKAYKIRTQEELPTQGPTAPHVASPDVVVDNENQEFKLYFHGLVEGSIQMTKLATSKNGIDFTAKDELIGAPYMRLFKKDDYYYGFAMPGLLYRSKDGVSNWEMRERWFMPPNTRHSGVHVMGDLLYVFYSRVGDAPERILYTTIDMSDDDWNEWTVGKPYELLKPELGWEGSQKLPVPSIRGEIGSQVNQLRDPFVFKDTDGKLYLLYAGGGEQAIGMARLKTI